MATFYLSAFADEAGGGIKEQIEALKAHGMTHIEPRGLDEGNISLYTEEQAKALKKILDESKIQISAIGSHYGKIKITDDFTEHFENFKNCVKVAKILGAKRIRMFSFYFSENEKFEDYKDEVFRRIELMCNYALENGIFCCHENEKGIYGDNEERCFEILSHFKGKLKGVFDPANFIQCGVKILPAFELLKDYIDYLHIKDCVYSDGSIRPAGAGDGEIVELLKRFNEVKNGDTFLTLEPHLKVFDGLKDLEEEGGTADKLKDDFTYKTNREAFDVAADALKSCLEKAKIVENTIIRY
ncbi:MAG: sugar phosphate isomerase/epimerase [Ruminococcaceae bacterium]|nr:sugar phosphate isomerase/epimerase [Oscillospiraceae bacterium]